MAKLSKWTALIKKFAAEIKKEGKLKGIAIGREAIKRAKIEYAKIKKSK